MNLWRNDHSRFNRQLWMLVANDNLRRSNLLHGGLRQPSLDGWQLIVIATTTAAANHLLRYRQGVGVWRWRN
jgi:hypothetical protein